MYQEFILFLGTDDLKETDHFYRTQLGLGLYKDQKTCKIYKINEASSIGFCTHLNKTIDGRSPILTLIVDDVGQVYERLQDQGADLEGKPVKNEQFNIYHFFFKDNNGYTIEIQKFL
ncbi:MAG: VOC family protein [Clostridiaceae bacterium]|nr:VOC family protein [Clostridiaceae bacterium]